ncbi:MAG: choice-of-anchor D domain-containing protein, partial [Planctomycetota bacterium]
YTFTGAFTDGAVTVDFVAGSVADGQDNPLAGSSQGFTVADVIAPTAALAAPADGANIGDKTLNPRGYIDVTFADGGLSGLNLSTITDAGAEFTLGGAAASGVTVNGAATLVSGTTYRYTFTGAFTPGTVTVDFVAGSVADSASNTIAAASQGFTVFDQDIVPPTATLADPANGSTIDDTVINPRGTIDVTFSDTGGSGLSLSTIADAGAEFTLSGSAASGVAVNGTPTLVSGTTYRYSFTGAFTGGLVTVDFLAGGVADAQGNLIAGSSQSFTVHLVDTTKPTGALANPANGSSIVDVNLNAQGYIDVTFADSGGSGLNLATITDVGAEFTLVGAAASGVTVDGAATLVSGTTYRYSFTGVFTGGTVSVQFTAGAWADNAGNLNDAAPEGFTTLHGLPEILVSGSGQEIVSGDATPASADGTAFGALNVGSPLSHTFAIQNTGTIPLNLTGTPRVQVSGANPTDFIVTTQPTASIAASGSSTFTIRFNPTAVGVRTATITILNDDSDEGSYTFTVQGTGGRKLSFGGKTPAVYTDASDDTVTMALKDIGSGEVWFANTDPAVHADASSVLLSTTGIKSALTVSIAGVLKRTTVGDIKVAGPMLQIAGTGLTVNGDIFVDGTLGSLTLDTLSGSDVEIRRNGAAAADSKAQLTLTANVVQDTTLDTHGEPIKSIKVWEWTDVDGQPNDAIVSSWIGSLTTLGRKALIGGLAGDFEAHLDLAIARDNLSVKPAALALGSATFAGTLTPGVWQIVGGVGAIKATAIAAGQITSGAVKSITTAGDFMPTRWDITGDLGALTVGGTVHSTVTATGNMGALTFGAATGSDFLAGVTTTAAGNPAITRHADNLADLNLATSIKGVTIKGIKGAPVTTKFFQDSNFSAGSIGAVSLVNVKYDAGTTGAHADEQFGFWGHAIKSVGAKNLADKADIWSWPRQALTATQVDLTIQQLS